MFQKSLLKNFIKSFNRPDDNDIIKFVNQNKFIAEDANGAEFIMLLSKYLNWHNCVREVKNDTDMKKADGVVYDKNENPIAIVELKSSDKKLANRDIIAQAFRYKNEKPTCKYVIISNFKQLDIYSESSEVCHSIDMTTSSQSSYEELYALLNQQSLENHEIQRLKKNSKSQDEITKEIYKEYSAFRLKLLNNLIEKNPTLSREEVFESANKLLDRYMFILFAEDRGLIPANSIDAIINKYKNDKQWGDNRPLYDYYKKYFDYIDVGNVEINIPMYNGNLFKPDAQLEALIIDDHIIKADLSSLSAYDFSDDVDVEVLGHIFEQSLNDLEKIKESLFTEHKIVNTRKKDGVFYTPKFVTEYIINNTVAKLCEEKKEALKLHKELKDTKKNNENRRDALQEYITYLSGLKIVDPACGSGAFLTACFRYLLNEHSWAQKALAKAGAGLFENHDIDKQIIENNLFGVDINGASVGIAKLSLWLQTAKRDRPLSDLMGNIKCANSLTADWDELFDFKFDVVIGNPPYGASFSKEDKKELKEIYATIYKGKFDSYHFFIQRGMEILKENGLMGYIVPDTWTSLQQTEKLRKFILGNKIIALEQYAFKVFDDANVDTITLVLEKINKINTTIKVSIVQKDFIKQEQVVSQKRFLKNDGLIFNYQIDEKDVELLNKIKHNKAQIKDFCDSSQGLVPYSRGGQSEEIVSTRGYHANYAKDSTFKREIDGRDIGKYSLEWNGNSWISYGSWLHRSRQQKFFTEPRVLVQRIRNPKLKIRIVATYTEEEYYNNPALSNFIRLENSTISLKFILAILNSKMINWVYTKSFTDVNIKPTDLENLPISNISKEDQQPFITLVDTIITAKENIAKYKKHMDSMSAIEKVELKEETEKLEALVQTSVDTIDQMVYALYGLSADEVALVEGEK